MGAEARVNAIFSSIHISCRYIVERSKMKRKCFMCHFGSGLFLLNALHVHKKEIAVYTEIYSWHIAKRRSVSTLGAKMWANEFCGIGGGVSLCARRRMWEKK